MSTTRAKPTAVFVASTRPLAGSAAIGRLAMRLPGLACKELPFSPDWTVCFKNGDLTTYRFTPAV